MRFSDLYKSDDFNDVLEVLSAVWEQQKPWRIMLDRRADEEGEQEVNEDEEGRKRRRRKKKNKRRRKKGRVTLKDYLEEVIDFSIMVK